MRPLAAQARSERLRLIGVAACCGAGRRRCWTVRWMIKSATPSDVRQLGRPNCRAVHDVLAWPADQVGVAAGEAACENARAKTPNLPRTFSILIHFGACALVSNGRHWGISSTLTPAFSAAWTPTASGSPWSSQARRRCPRPAGAVPAPNHQRRGHAGCSTLIWTFISTRSPDAATMLTRGIQAEQVDRALHQVGDAS